MARGSPGLLLYEEAAGWERRPRPPGSAGWEEVEPGRELGSSNSPPPATRTTLGTVAPHLFGPSPISQGDLRVLGQLSFGQHHSCIPFLGIQMPLRH